MQYLSFPNTLNIPFSIRYKRSWRLILEKSFKKNKNTETKIEVKNFLVVKKKGEVNTKSCFKSAENCGASSLWVGRHRYTRFLQVCDYLKRYGQHTEILRNSTKV